MRIPCRGLAGPLLDPDSRVSRHVSGASSEMVGLFPPTGGARGAWSTQDNRAPGTTPPQYRPAQVLPRATGGNRCGAARRTRSVQGLGAERQAADAVLIDLDGGPRRVLPGQDLLGHRVLEVLPDGPLERPRPVLRVPPDLREVRLRPRRSARATGHAAPAARGTAPAGCRRSSRCRRARGGRRRRSRRAGSRTPAGTPSSRRP